MVISRYYSIADFPFRIIAEEKILNGLTSFEPFVMNGSSEEGTVFTATVEEAQTASSGMPSADEDIKNDFGHIRMCHGSGFYTFELNYDETGWLHTMTVDSGMKAAAININYNDKYYRTALSSLIHILFSMAILPMGGIMLHASAVTLDGKGYAFLGKSGTGKSTHSLLWQISFPECRLLNDDNPVVAVKGDKIKIYGTPWSGKTACYKNEYATLEALVRLEQWQSNEFTLLTDTAAFAGLLPSCSVIRSDRRLTEFLYKTLIEICERITIGRLRCLPNGHAARLCREYLK